MKFEKMNELLKDASSPYYCGSSCLLSLTVLYDCIEKTCNREFKKNFSSFKKDVLSLFDEDTRLFEISKKKEELLQEEWDRIIGIFGLYENVLTSLKEFIDFCIFARKGRIVSFLLLDLEFLSKLALDNLNLFSQRENAPETFLRIRHDIVSSIDKPFRFENDSDETLKGEESSVLLSLLPIESMLLKLMNRKQKSKRPFSFDFDKKKEFILSSESEFRQMISKRKIENTSLLLKELSSIALQAKEEIKMDSLKQDYQYLSDMFLCGVEYFSRN